VAFHQAAHAGLGRVQPTPTECPHQTGAAVTLAALVKDGFHGIGQHAILTAAQALWLVAMRVKAAGRSTQCRARLAHLKCRG